MILLFKTVIYLAETMLKPSETSEKVKFLKNIAKKFKFLKKKLQKFQLFWEKKMRNF